MDGEHPCNICENRICERAWNYGNCVWQYIYSASASCENYDCMLNHEGSCLGSFYDKCGSQKK